MKLLTVTNSLTEPPTHRRNQDGSPAAAQPLPAHHADRPSSPRRLPLLIHVVPRRLAQATNRVSRMHQRRPMLLLPPTQELSRIVPLPSPLHLIDDPIDRRHDRMQRVLLVLQLLTQAIHDI